MSINALKNLDTDRYDLDELVALSAEGKALQAEFTALGVDVPEWLDTSVRSIQRDVRTRQADAVEKRVRQLKSRIQAMKPAAERRAEAEKELAELEARLK